MTNSRVNLQTSQAHYTREIGRIMKYMRQQIDKGYDIEDVFQQVINTYGLLWHDCVCYELKIRENWTL